jgi:Ni,Fe-hydrogenase I large subunit
MLVAYASGQSRVKQVIDASLAKLGLQKTALFSTLGRVLARTLETQVIAEQLPLWIEELNTNLNTGKLDVFNKTKWQPTSWPVSAQGLGMTEAPRGALGHWISIANGKIANYQIVIPSTWNGSPRDSKGQRGAWEQALLNTAVLDPNRPIEILRTVHSYDPCMACAVHVIDSQGSEVTKVRVV